MPALELRPVEYENKVILGNLLQFYRYDFSVYDEEDVNPHGLFNYRYLDAYWYEYGRYPYFIMCDGQYIGFSLVRHGAYHFQQQQHDADIVSLAEFFIMKRYRRKGLGREAAHQTFNLMDGLWQVNTPTNNTPARQFWEQTIQIYTKDNYTTITRDDEVVWYFDNRK